MSKGEFSSRVGAGVTVCLWALLFPTTVAAQSNQLSDKGCGNWYFTDCLMPLLSSIQSTTGPNSVETDSETSVPYDVCLYTPPYVIGQLNDGSTELYFDATYPAASCDVDPVTGFVTADLPFSYPPPHRSRSRASISSPAITASRTDARMARTATPSSAAQSMA